MSEPAATAKDPKTGYALFPRLCLMYELGLVWLEGSEYVGRADDGIVVALGITGEEPRLERYLADYPNGSTW